MSVAHFESVIAIHAKVNSGILILALSCTPERRSVASNFVSLLVLFICFSFLVYSEYEAEALTTNSFFRA